MPRNKLRWLFCLSLLVLLVGCASAASPERFGRLYDAYRNRPQIQPPAESVPSESQAIVTDPIEKAHVVVFAARPGDALTGAFTWIRETNYEIPARVVIVYVTNGDAQTAVAQALANLPKEATPTPRQYLHAAAVLQESALNVAENALDLHREDIIFLSYPDGVLHEMTEAAPDHVVRSPYTEKDGVHDPNVTPYRILRSGHGLPYSFNAIVRDMNDVLVELNAKMILFPSPASEDETAAAVGRLVARSLLEVGPPSGLALEYGIPTEIKSSTKESMRVDEPAEKQRALNMYAQRIGIPNWPAVMASQLEMEVFGRFHYQCSNVSRDVPCVD
jgi:hypothetical protein